MEKLESPETNLDEIHGRICNDCRLVWVGGFDAQETGLDPETSSTFSTSAEAFAESVKASNIADEEDTGHGYFQCLFCDETHIGGFTAVLKVTP